MGPAGRRALEGLGQRRGGRAAGARHPAVRGDGHEGAPRAQEGPPQGRLHGRRRQQGQRARRWSRSRAPTPTASCEFGFDRPPSRDQARQTRCRRRCASSRRSRSGSAAALDKPLRGRPRSPARRRPSGSPPSRPPPRAARRRPSAGGRFRIPGMSSPQVFKPQLYEPGVSIGPGGINFRKPQFRGPQVQGPQMGSKDLKLSNLKGRGGAAAAAPVMPLLPSQGVFRQRAWLPWWLIPVLALLIALLLLLYLLLPRNAEVPDLVGSASAFEAEELLDRRRAQARGDAEGGGLRRGPARQRDRADAEGRRDRREGLRGGAADRDRQRRRSTVPDIVGQTPRRRREDAARQAGSRSARPRRSRPTPRARSRARSRRAGEVVKEGTPVDIFFQPKAAGEGEGEGEGRAAAVAAVPAVAAAEAAAAAAARAARSSCPPSTARRPTSTPARSPTRAACPSSSARSTAPSSAPCSRTEPGAGDRGRERQQGRMLVSAGFPQLVFDNDENILRVNGADGKRLDPVADEPGAREGPGVQRRRHARRLHRRRADLPRRPREAGRRGGRADAGGRAVRRPAWAPTAGRQRARLRPRRATTATATCASGGISGGGMTPGCIDEPKIAIGSAIHWSPDGKSILGRRRRARPAASSASCAGSPRRPFSADPGDWGKGRFVTDTSQARRGRQGGRAVARRQAPRARSPNVGGRAVRARARPSPATSRSRTPSETGVRACKVAWRPDGRELAVIQADAGLQRGRRRARARDPRASRTSRRAARRQRATTRRTSRWPRSGG